MKSYEAFLAGKKIIDTPSGKACDVSRCHPTLFEFQKLAVAWAVQRGRAAIFSGCGTGKTLMQLDWARLVGARTLILAPLCVANQTVREASKLGMQVCYAKSQDDAGHVTVTNYERLDVFDPAQFDAVVLDESSILKSFDGNTKRTLIEAFGKTPFRLCCTATPAPNDISEIANHSEFLGVMNRTELLATFFVHDEQDWRLKGHAQQAFWKWLVSWSLFFQKPSDLGCEDTGWELPQIKYHETVIDTDFKQDGMLFGMEVKGLSGRLAARRGTLQHKVAKAADLVNGSREQWLVWCEMNSESDALRRAIPDSVEIKGSDSREHKETSILGFVDGSIRVLVTKPDIAGFGMNFQNCRNMLFVGLSDSFESEYQAVRRCWRFGQKKPVNVHILTADVENPIVANIKRKEALFQNLYESMLKQMKTTEIEAVTGTHRESVEYKSDTITHDEFALNLGDTCEWTSKMPNSSIDMSVCSPPFASLYTYTNSERDMGNCRSEDEFFEHYRFLLSHWLRITKSGRLACVHVAQIAAMLVRDGFIGMKDFRGRVIREHVAAGWIYHGEFVIDKNPQAQAIRTKSKGLTFSQLEKDSSWSRPAIADYVIIFRKPGENSVKIDPDVSRDEWIEWARPCWRGISETDTLNVREAREDKDERHICPLQLETIRRCVRLYSNRGETVFSPFAGIGSEGYVALEQGRKFIGNELKECYWRQAAANLRSAIARRSEGCFAFMEKKS